jgi:hypothetical protein
MAPRIETMISSGPGQIDDVRQLVAISTAAIEPERYCPLPPMLKRPQRNANARRGP